MFKIGLIGCGNVAVEGHLPAIREVGRLKLHAIFDPKSDTLQRVGDQFDVPVRCTDLNEFLESGVDAVVITSPAPVHKENVLAAVRHRLPILCEKPLALTAEDGWEMVRAASEYEVPLYTAFCYRFSPVAMQIRELLRNGAIGDPRSLRLIYNWDLHGKYRPLADGTLEVQKRRQGRMLEGGPMIDCGTHQIDLAQYWLQSELVGYHSHGAWVEDYEAPDHMWLHLDYANGAHAVVEISYSYHQVSHRRRREFVYEIIGTDGVIRYDRDARLFVLDDARAHHEFPFSDEKDFVGMYEAFASALETGSSELLADGHQGLAVAEVAQRATTMAMRNRVMKPALQI